MPNQYRRLLALFALFVGGIGSGCRVDDRILTTADGSPSLPDASIGTRLDGGAGDARGDARVEGGTHVCQPGQTRCSTTGVPQKCNTAGTAYEDQSPCPTSTPVCDATTGTCTTACTTGDKRCNPAKPVIQQCDQQGIWQDTQTCPYACSGTGAGTGCTGDCPPGTRSCGENDTPVLCDDTGTNKPDKPCETGFCREGACVGDCKPNATRCAAGDSKSVQTCDLDGHWGAATACLFVCDPTTGDCGGECSPGAAPRCSGNTVQSCDATGHWATMTVCQGSPCSRGQCRPCTANEKQCNAGKPQTCGASGVWTDDQATACNFTCDAASGLCVGVCVPGMDYCSTMPPAVSTHCDAAGSFGPPTTCTNICDSKTGKCGGVCPPTTHRCNGQNSETCGADGQWGSGTVCPFGCSATTGQCNACTDEPMTTTCSAGKCGPTINNCGKAVTCSSTCSGMGESCGGGGVMGVCGCRPEASTQTCQNGMRCGNVPNNCGLTVACASNCVAPQTCGGGGTANVCGCTPKTQAVACAGKNCDAVSDGCGGMINCGACTSPQTCGGGSPGMANVCGCTPKTAAAACGTRTCGTQPDGCNGTVNCGSMNGGCPSGTACNSTGACASTCMPLTTCPTGKNCGTIDPGCGAAMLSCGSSCTAPNTCGGGGTANVCGCTPLTMTAACAGKCGSVSNGCGGTINCGTTSCTGVNTCGGGGTPNVCGCTPSTTTVACAGGKCGSVSNGCGGMIDCGNTCTGVNTCGGGGTVNVCGCTRLTPAQACATGQNCGTAPDGCGSTVTCGTCTSPNSCGGGGTPNVCGCRATTCPSGSNCGTVTNVCNNMAVSCGSAVCGTGTNQGCGGMGVPNVCGCMRNSTTTTCMNKCGNVTDNCGTVVTCPACASGQECAQSPATPVNVCCTRETDAQLCGRLVKNCGALTGVVDSCGFTRNVTTCGSCTSPQTCGASNVCGCPPETDAQFCTRLRASCGLVTATDNCGASRSVNCGTCAAGQGCCGANTCVALTASPNCGACGVTCDSAHACSNSACRLVNGQRGCSTATDCVSPLPCTRFFTDGDGDGHGDLTRPVNQCGTTPGTGLVANSDDCCDGNANAFPRPPPSDPTAGPWFPTPVTGTCVAGHKPFDYDCDGFETQEDPLPFDTCAGDIDTCGPTQGIFVAPVPACGVSTPFNARACVFLDDGTGCISFEPFTKIQNCR